MMAVKAIAPRSRFVGYSSKEFSYSKKISLLERVSLKDPTDKTIFIREDQPLINRVSLGKKDKK